MALDFITDVIKPNPGPDDKIGSGKQYQFLDALTKYKFILYGGQAGGGKSYILRWGAVWFLIYMWKKYGVQNGKVGLFCEDYPTLTDRQLTKIKADFPKWLGRLHETRTDGLVFELDEAWGGGMIMLRNLDDPRKYDSTEFMAIFVDELTKNLEQGPQQPFPLFDELRKRLRWPGLPEGVNLPFAAGTNPGGKGHVWVKRLWIDPPTDLPPELRPHAREFKFIPAASQENPYNPPDYFMWLQSLRGALRKALAEGDWNLFEGQFFSEWRTELHTCKPFAIPAYWRKFAAMDWGESSPACVLWFAIDPDGKLYVYRELYEAHKTNEWLAKTAARMNGADSLDYRVLDPSCFPSAEAIQIGKSNAEQLHEFGWTCTKAASARIDGWSQVRQYLAWDRNADGLLTRKPAIQIFNTCENLIRTLPALVYDAHKANDLDSDGDDHCADSLRYGIMSRPQITQVPLDQMPEEYADAARRADHDEKEARK